MRMRDANVILAARFSQKNGITKEMTQSAVCGAKLGVNTRRLAAAALAAHGTYPSRAYRVQSPAEKHTFR